MGRSRVIVFAWVVVLAAVSVSADDHVVLYTNADLEKFGPPSDRPGPVVNETGDQAFVTEFLNREHARLEEERAHELERLRTEAEVRIARPAPAVAIGYPYYGVRVGHSYRHGQRIVPLHARPTTAQMQHKKASSLSGVDAFPSNRRRAQRKASR